VFEGSDACFAPVLSFSEARTHPHNLARRSHVAVGGVDQPAPAPRFSRTAAAVARPPPERGALGREALADWGFSRAAIHRLAALGVGFAR
jgi:alpha-methylacyl-CoA racemase